MKSIHHLLLITSAFFITSCFSYKSVSVERIDNVQIKNIGPKGVEAQITAKINNPNNYSIKVKSSDLLVSLNKSEIGTANIVKPVKIKKKSTDSYQVDIFIVYKDLAGGILQTLPSLFLKKSVRMHLKGTIKGKVGLLSKKVDVETTQDVNLSK